MNTCPTCGRIDGALRPHLLLDSENLCPGGAPGDYPPDDPADLEGRGEWGPEESNSGDPGEWVNEPDELPAPLPETLPELPEPPAPKAKRGRKGRVSAEPAPIVEDLLTRVAGDAFQMFCPVESCRSEVTAVFDGKRLVLAEHVHPKHLGRCPCVVVPRKHWPPELTRAALERAGEWMVGEASDPGVGVSISTPEPAPLAGTGDVWAEIIALEPEPSLREVFAARRQFGIDKYGTPLQRNNGRNHNNDIAQELCDGVVYARAAERPATEAVLRDLLFHGEAYAEDVTNVGAAPRSLYYALGVSDLTAAHQRIDALRQAEKGLEQVLAAAREGATTVGVARELSQMGRLNVEPKITLSVEGAEAFQIAALKAQVGTLETQVALQRGRIRRLLEYVNETEKQVTVPEGWTALDEDGCDLADYQAQILDIDDCLNTVDPDNRARSEDDTTAKQVISILRRMVDGSEDLAAALQPTADGVRVTLTELGGNPPRAVFVADVSRKTAQRLGKSPGLYGLARVLLPVGDP